LSAGAFGCSQPDDIVVSVQPQLVDAGVNPIASGTGGAFTGTGGASTGTGGVSSGAGGTPVTSGSGGAQMPADPCPEEPGIDDLKDVIVNNCVVDKNDPRVRAVAAYFNTITIPPSGEGSDISPCDFDVRTWYYEDSMTGQWVLCPRVCEAIKLHVQMETRDHDACLAMHAQP
jgi:hypothetical protein